jgi:uncharacterized membrane protein YeaQ/YmgE (transglycosylase-associated protein family)
MSGAAHYHRVPVLDPVPFEERRSDMELVYFLLIGALAGWLAGTLTKGSGFGLVGNIVIGVLGALVGGYLFRSIGIWSDGGLLGTLITALVGAIVLLFLLSLVRKPKQI